MNVRRFIFWFAIYALGFTFTLAACSSSGERLSSVYLNTHQDELQKPISVDSRPVRFVVQPGTPARVIGQNLVKAGLISDDRLFEAYVRVNGLDEKLSAGTFVLAPSMTLVEIVQTLQYAEAASVTVTIPEGWRREQITDYLVAAGVFSSTTNNLR